MTGSNSLRLPAGLALLCLLSACATPLPNSYFEDLDAWQAQRLEALVGPGGWLYLVDNHWLREGRWTLGIGRDRDIRLPDGPLHMGVLDTPAVWPNVCIEESPVRE